jgi:outer membrane protein assembly factor BamB
VDRKISLRMFVLGTLLSIVLMDLIAWQAVTNLGDSFVKSAAVRVAIFPTLVQEAWTEAIDRISGRGAYRYLSVPRPKADYSAFKHIPSIAGVPQTGLLMRGNTAAVVPGWRLFAGAILVDAKVTNAVVLVDPTFHVRKIWKVNEKGVRLLEVALPERKVIHGLALLPDHSIVVNMDDGHSIQRLDSCGHRMWLHEGLYNHVVSYNPDDGTVWTLQSDGAETARETPVNEGAPPRAFVQLDAKSGRIVRRFTVRQIMDANPKVTIFDIRHIDLALVQTNAKGALPFWAPEPFHFNDVEPLTAAMASAFPQFAPGDLLISSRNLNALFVLDPKTLQIKWYTVGATLRQHDPDWRPDGTISVFDNRMDLGSSQIVSIDPKTGTRKVLLDGAKVGFYSRIRGRQMYLVNGDLIIASPQQGMGYEVGLHGKVLMQYANPGPAGTNLNLALTNLDWLPPGTFTQEDATCATL